MTKLEGKLLEIIDRQSRVIDQQQQQLEDLRGTVSSLRAELARICRSLRDQHSSSPFPGDSGKLPMNPCVDKDPLNIRGPSDWPPAPPITCDEGTYIGGPAVPKDYTYVGGSITVTPDPDQLPYGYDPKDPLNSRSVSLNTQEHCTYQEWRKE